MSRGSIEYSFVVNKNRIERAGKKNVQNVTLSLHCIRWLDVEIWAIAAVTAADRHGKHILWKCRMYARRTLIDNGISYGTKLKRIHHQICPHCSRPSVLSERYAPTVHNRCSPHIMSIAFIPIKIIFHLCQLSAIRCQRARHIDMTDHFAVDVVFVFFPIFFSPLFLVLCLVCVLYLTQFFLCSPTRSFIVLNKFASIPFSTYTVQAFKLDRAILPAGDCAPYAHTYIFTLLDGRHHSQHLWYT